MKNFIKQIFNKIEKLDKYTSLYVKSSHNIEIPAIAYTNWGIHLAEIKDFESAIDKLETAILMSNQNPKPCINLGIIYARLKEYDKAEMVLKKAVERDSQNAHTYSVLSSVLVAKDKYDEAEDAIKKGLKLAPCDSEIYLNYGILLAKQQKKHKAIEMFKKSKFFNPTNFHAYFLLGVMLFETDKIAEAFCEFKQLENLKPNYKNLNYYLALCYKKEMNYIAVTEYAQRALEEDPSNPSVHILLAQNYITMKKESEGLKIYNTALEKGIDDFELYLSWGISLLKINDINSAKEKLFKALERKENDSNALYRVGYCFHKEDDFENAEKYYKLSINADPQNSMAYADLGIIYYEKKNYEDAITSFLKAINISSKMSYLYFYVANCYYKQGRLKKSLDYYEKTIEYYPTHLEALINCTVNLLDMNNVKEALRKIRSAYQINRESEKVLLVYALTEFKSGLYNDTIEKIDILLSMYPENKEAKYIKAHALINLNKAQEALNILYSMSEEEKDNGLFVYLNYLAYKILVEVVPSNYNENMLNLYGKKLEEINIDNVSGNEVMTYLNKTLNINKG